MFRKRSKVLLAGSAIVGLAGGVVGLSSLPAAAEPGPALTTVYEQYASIAYASPPGDSICDIVYYNHVTAGYACFRAYGDVFWIRDTAHDGHHIEMRGAVSPTQDGFRCYSARNPDVGWQRCTGFAKKIPENGSIFFNACLYEGTKLLSTGLGKNAFTY